MELANRPWVSLFKVEPSSPLTFKYDAPYINLKFTLSNSGHSPATDVAIFPELLPFIPDGTDRIGAALKERDKVCKIAATTPHSGIDMAAATGWEEVQDVMAATKDIKQILSAARIINFFLVGCVDYSFTYEPGHHQQSFYYIMTMKDPQATGGYIPTNKGDIQPSELKIGPYGQTVEINN